jgi:hypothetical protein
METRDPNNQELQQAAEVFEKLAANAERAVLCVPRSTSA